MTTKTYGIRSDLHGRWQLAEDHYNQFKDGTIEGVIDLGDIEAPYIDANHPLRTGQTKDEQTMNAIARNALNPAGKLTELGKTTLKETFEGIFLMDLITSTHIQDKAFKANYRAIKGNAEESWTKVLEKIAPHKVENMIDDMRQFRQYHEPHVDYVIDGNYTQTYNIKKELPSTGVLYLPWKSTPYALERNLEELDKYDLEHILVMGHDYFTKDSLKPDMQENTKPMQNEKQVHMVLDYLSGTDSKVDLYYGHIGCDHEAFDVDFNYKGKEFHAHHTDEKNGELTYITI